MADVVDLDSNTAKQCYGCGVVVVTTRLRVPLCILCRDRGLRTVDDVRDAQRETWEEGWLAGNADGRGKPRPNPYDDTER